VHIGIDWLAGVAFGHIDKIGERVLIIGVGNTAMDCCRTSRRLGGKDVKVMARRGRQFFKASPWELEDAEEEQIDILVNHVPKRFVVEGGKLKGMEFDRVEYVDDGKGRQTAKKIDTIVLPADDVILAIGQENAFPWIERDAGIAFDEWGMPVLDATTLQSSLPRVFFGGDAALGPKNIIWAVAQGHAAAISIDKFLHGEDVQKRPAPGTTLVSQKMGIHEWSYDNDITSELRHKVPWRDVNQSLRNIKVEVELGFDAATAWKEAQRCLNCDVQTVFATSQCIECDACVDICPTDCITFTANGDEPDLRTRLRAPARHADQALYVSDALKTGRVMVKDEDVCLHCGLCAERCPTGAWDMQKFTVSQTRAGSGCRNAAPKKVPVLT
jgi:ferredoxin